MVPGSKARLKVQGSGYWASESTGLGFRALGLWAAGFGRGSWFWVWFQDLGIVAFFFHPFRMVDRFANRPPIS